MFQFPGFPMQHYGFMLHSMVLHHGSFLIRKSADIMLICSSPRLIAACHVLHRLLMPRHSPYALVRLNFLLYDSMIILGSRSLNCLSFSLSSRSAELSFRIILTLLRCEKAIRLLHFVLSSTISVKLFSLTIWKDSIISYFVLFCSFSYSNLSSIRLSKIASPARSLSTHFPSCDVRGLPLTTPRLAGRTAAWSVWMDSNHRPRAYQARALAT